MIQKGRLRINLFIIDGRIGAQSSLNVTNADTADKILQFEFRQ